MRRDYRTLFYDGAVVRIDPVSGVCHVLTRGLRFANGLAFAPDGTLYVNESMSGDILRLRDDGACACHVNVMQGDAEDAFGPDGMAVAADGTLYCAVYGGGHVAVVPPGVGGVSARIAAPGKAAINVSFVRDGGKKLFVTEVEHGALHCIPVDRRGLPLYEPEL